MPDLFNWKVGPTDDILHWKLPTLLQFPTNIIWQWKHWRVYSFMRTRLDNMEKLLIGWKGTFIVWKQVDIKIDYRALKFRMRSQNVSYWCWQVQLQEVIAMMHLPMRNDWIASIFLPKTISQDSWDSSAILARSYGLPLKTVPHFHILLRHISFNSPSEIVQKDIFNWTTVLT